MRDSTTLLRTQCDALRNLPPEQFYLAVTAIWDYEMDGKEASDPVAAMAVGMAKPIIDKRAKRAAAGALGGSRPKQTEASGKQTEANSKQTEANGPYKEESIKIKDKSKKIKDIDRRFTPPTLEEVQAYIQEHGYQVDANRFIDFYSSKGWMVGRNKMKDWQAALRGWSSRDKTKQGSKFNNFQESNTDWNDVAYQIMATQ